VLHGCAKIISLIIFKKTLKSDHYASNTLNPFFNQLTAAKRQYGYFQQNIPCTAKAFWNEITCVPASISEDKLQNIWESCLCTVMHA
jgi:hypothetical protein